MDKDNIWTQFALSILNDVDRDVVKQMLLSFGIDAGLYGTKAVRKNREKYKCNIPFNILLTLQVPVISTVKAVGLLNTVTSRIFHSKKCKAL